MKRGHLSFNRCPLSQLIMYTHIYTIRINVFWRFQFGNGLIILGGGGGMFSICIAYPLCVVCDMYKSLMLKVTFNNYIVKYHADMIPNNILSKMSFLS